MLVLTQSVLAQDQKSLSFTPKLLAIDNNEACDVGDVDRDGLLDIVAGRWWFAAPDFIPRPLRALGIAPPDYAKNNGEHLADINKDGWLDVITTGWGETKILWFENPGKDGLEKGLLWKEHELVDTGISRSELGLLEDLDGDGKPEYVMNSWFEENPFMIWQLVDGSAGMVEASGIEVGLRNGHGVGFGDINQDGKKDILFDDGWYQQPDKLSDAWTWQQHWRLDDSSCPMQVVDLNNDGKVEVIFGRGHHYGLYWMEQIETAAKTVTWEKHIIDESWSQVHAMVWADLDGDGVGELITGKRVWAHSGKDPGAEESPVIYRYIWDQPTRTFQRHQIHLGTISTGLFIRVADLNNDSKPDLVMAGKKGTFILWQD